MNHASFLSVMLRLVFSDVCSRVGLRRRTSLFLFISFSILVAPD